MAHIRSFRDLVENQCFDEISECIEAYVDENPDKFEGKSNIVEDPDEAELSSKSIEFVEITKLYGNTLEFDVVVSTEIAVRERRRHSDVDDDAIYQWFRVSCSAILEDGLNDFKATDVHIYNKQRRNKKGYLSEYLVPMINKEDLDEIAEEFLSDYYPQMLQKPMALPVENLAECMGLSIERVHITKNCSVFGQIFFSNCTTRHYDPDTQVDKPIYVEKGTIFVDPNVFFLRTLGSVNNTIVHECVHWYKHRKFFELEKMFNPEAKAMRCQVSESRKRKGEERTPYEWMEWQANALAPRILMPAKMTRLKIEELLEKNRPLYDENHTCELMESVIFELANFFDVSIEAAKIRMLDLGYQQVEGVCTFVDKHYIMSYCFEEGAIRRGQTFTIDSRNAVIEYGSNPKLREMVDSSKYIYVDAHYCINDSKYVKFDDTDSIRLTDYALQHMDECCLIFDIEKKKRNNSGAAIYTECVLFREALSQYDINLRYTDSDHNKAVEERAAKLKAVSKQNKGLAKIKQNLPPTFSGSLSMLMKEFGFTNESLETVSSINQKTISRIRNNECYEVTLRTVIAICIGMSLPPVLSEDLITKSGHSYKCNEEHITMRQILTTMYGESIYTCNDVMREMGFRPIAKESD